MSYHFVARRLELVCELFNSEGSGPERIDGIVHGSGFGGDVPAVRHTDLGVADGLALFTMPAAPMRLLAIARTCDGSGVR